MNRFRGGVRRKNISAANSKGQISGGVNTSNAKYSEMFIGENTIWPEGWALPAGLIFEG